MKKLVILLFSVSIFQLSIGQSFKNVALVSIHANKTVQTDFSSGVLETIREITGVDKKFSTEDQLKLYHDLFFGELQEKLPFSLIEESKVISNEEYSNVELAYESQSQYQSDIACDGYRVITKLRDKEVEKLLTLIDGVDGLMIVDLAFSLQPNTLALNTGMGAANGMAYLGLKVYDKTGKVVLRLNSKALSKGKVKMALSKVSDKDVEAVPDILIEAADQLLIQVNQDLPKKIEKMYKKLN